MRGLLDMFWKRIIIQITIAYCAALCTGETTYYDTDPAGQECGNHSSNSESWKSSESIDARE